MRYHVGQQELEFNLVVMTCSVCLSVSLHFEDNEVDTEGADVHGHTESGRVVTAVSVSQAP